MSGAIVAAWGRASPYDGVRPVRQRAAGRDGATRMVGRDQDRKDKKDKKDKKRAWRP
ncbi:hypothetical protein [Streptosporangium sp. V21-05]|uniref:hypothetical protein n=1 Tax=Streptosporangium sp. V21-05 TaxID=3446115 RepID=UPI003F52FB5A